MLRYNSVDNDIEYNDDTFKVRQNSTAADRGGGVLFTPPAATRTFTLTHASSQNMSRSVQR